ncbi:alpha/beta fold hydrolase [Nesterenkonia rhizosphaerae]|uniref:alpha/beta fold hydrolase n=1 Tax=Nesterenkonia rhizosphaerae TaxID=1348272 RepID=UPI003CD07EC8
MLLLHGLAGSSLELLPTGKILLRTHRVLLLDQRGQGRSTRRPADLSREAFVADVVDVLQEFCPGEKVHGCAYGVPGRPRQT